jgi:hypothetical protein
MLKLNFVLMRHGLHSRDQVGSSSARLRLFLRERSGLEGLYQGIFYALEAATCHALLNEGFKPWLMDFDVHGGILP